jgi:hypothetical protein
MPTFPTTRPTDTLLYCDYPVQADTLSAGLAFENQTYFLLAMFRAVGAGASHSSKLLLTANRNVVGCLFSC